MKTIFNVWRWLLWLWVTIHGIIAISRWETSHDLVQFEYTVVWMLLLITLQTQERW